MRPDTVAVYHRQMLEGLDSLVLAFLVQGTPTACRYVGEGTGVLAAQAVKPQARVLAEARGIAWVEVDLAVLRGERDEAVAVLAGQLQRQVTAERVACHRHGWLPGLAASATIYVEELPFHHDQIARFIPEFVMAQLESDEAIAKIPHTTTRNLVIVLIGTGLRGGDACNLPFNPVLADSSGWPCLRFEAVKVRAEQLIPLSAKAATAIAAQQDYVRERWPGGSPWLFPGIINNPDGMPRQYWKDDRELA